MARGMGRVQRTIKALVSKQAAAERLARHEPQKWHESHMLWGLIGAFLAFLLFAAGFLVPNLAIARASLVVSWVFCVLALVLMFRDLQLRRRVWLTLLISMLVGAGLVLMGLKEQSVPNGPVTARIDVVDIVAVPAHSEARGAGLFVNIFYANKGSIPAQKLVHRCILVPSDTALTEREEVQYIAVADSVAFNGKDADADVQPGEHPKHYFSCPDEDKDIASLGNKYRDIIGGKTRLYVFVAMKYRDESLPSNTITVTEFCGWFLSTFEIWHNCGRNRIIQQSIH